MCAAVPGTSGSAVLDPNPPDGTPTPYAIALMVRPKKDGSCPVTGIKMSAICADDAKMKKLLECTKWTDRVGVRAKHTPDCGWCGYVGIVLPAFFF